MSFVGLSLSYSNNKLGGALYDGNTHTLSLIEDISEDSDFKLLDTLLIQTNPTHVTINVSQSDDFIKFVTDKSNEPRRNSQEYDSEELDENYVPETQFNTDNNKKFKCPSLADSNIVPETQEFSNDEIGDDQGDGPIKQFQLTECPSNTYSMDDARNLIKRMYESGQYERSNVENYNEAFKIDKSCVNMVQSIGALLKLLDRLRVGVEFEDCSMKTPIKTIKLLSINKILEIDQDSLSALDIFDNEYHPSATRIFGRKWGNKPKEGLSLFKFCNRCSSSMGKLVLKSWFERPSADLETIVTRHDAVDFFMDDQNIESIKIIKSNLRNIKSLEPIFKRCREGIMRPSDWKSIFISLTCAFVIKEELVKCRCSLKLLENFEEYFSKDISCLLTLFSEVVDFDGIEDENRFVAKRYIDKELDKLKDFYDNISNVLTEIAAEEFELYRLEACSVVYIPIFGYLLVIPSNILGPFSRSMELRFTENGSNFFKTPRMRDLDEKLGDIKFKISDLETNIKLRLQKRVVDNIGNIRNILKIIALVDCVVALASVSKELKWCRPTMVKEPILEISKARHPIAECLAGNSYVPNPINSGGSHTKVKLISGPNASGKSVYLKMTAICSYMAQIGCFVPATTAKMGIVDKIIVRMYTLDSVLDGMSTFAKDMKQMGVALNRSTGKSLVIIDEFGIGTIKETGLGLFASSLNYWINKGKINCPHIFASSHFHSLPNYLKNDPSILSYHTMRYHIESEKLTFLYCLTIGKVERSFANYVALKNGVPHAVIERSEHVYEEIKKGVDISEIEKLNYDTDERDGRIEEIVQKYILQFERCELNEDYLEFLQAIKMEFLEVFDLEDDDNLLSHPSIIS
ncbi:DNA mismatch repair protein MutS, C-terminal domain and DNA mismatch repair protein MutS, core domain and DNA mismatch repair protein MutS, clamp domain and P-loop containing nucleoside triphosphate hydrolase domain-containing protein [Strongyloides ratti]|uniref:MutS protein homolog 5 n=1 Tax=Strongyloides ratti TaxID=34506 RepID=A0A090L2P2_STRRB|nr:DNA mismatch repair protein MutS, C-terminal domain and DNA mismatch repair protein MutS, core domain and DNA mismatch repair protein MutS, clamp domain and P-loop containing nucleoside triphosphate hydrolase domain-containing protein [Strongyloides ratti]CEF62377.1 DNA mismatch repair protein MutS, C-terminal domain and DNA mismatch repair protein MutS, core domain and DNA mismatch repair protein MutS, clamp domain and P-loop containing nucleoside triphosphate hydrolase domain-containing prote